MAMCLVSVEDADGWLPLTRAGVLDGFRGRWHVSKMIPDGEPHRLRNNTWHLGLINFGRTNGKLPGSHVDDGL